MTGDKPESLTDLLDVLETAAGGSTVSVAQVLEGIGERSFTPLVLAISVLMVSPISGIPGLPTLSALLIVLVGVQGLLRRRHLWLPGVLMRREIAARHLNRAVGWLRRPAAWVDRHSYPRLRALTKGPARVVALALCVLVPMMWPALELLPFVTSAGAAAVALIAFGLFIHDGLYVLLGYTMCGGMLTGLVMAVL